MSSYYHNNLVTAILDGDVINLRRWVSASPNPSRPFSHGGSRWSSYLAFAVAHLDNVDPKIIRELLLLLRHSQHQLEIARDLVCQPDPFDTPDDDDSRNDRTS